MTDSERELFDERIAIVMEPHAILELNISYALAQNIANKQIMEMRKAENELQRRKNKVG